MLKHQPITFTFRARECVWSYVVLVAAFMVQFSSGGLPLANGVFFYHLHLKGGQNNTQISAAWGAGLSWGFGHILSPFITAMAARYSARPVCILGGFISGVGVVFNSISDSVVHVIISYSIIVSFGLAMCSITSQMILDAYFHQRREFAGRIRFAGQYAGAAVFAFTMDRIVTSQGWRLGMQCSTFVVVLNFLLGFCFLPVARYRNMLLKSHQMNTETPTRFRDCFDFSVFNERLMCVWLIVEFLVGLALYNPMLLMAQRLLNSNQPSEHYAIFSGVAAISAIVLPYLWKFISEKAVLPLLIVLKQHCFLLMMATITMYLSGLNYGHLVVLAIIYGSILGTTQVVMYFQFALLTKLPVRCFALSWCHCAFGLGAMLGSPLAVFLNEQYAVEFLGFVFALVPIILAVVVLVLYLRRLRERELALWADEEQRILRLNKLIHATPSASSGGGPPGEVEAAETNNNAGASTNAEQPDNPASHHECCSYTSTPYVFPDVIALCEKGDRIYDISELVEDKNLATDLQRYLNPDFEEGEISLKDVKRHSKSPLPVLMEVSQEYASETSSQGQSERRRSLGMESGSPCSSFNISKAENTSIGSTDQMTFAGQSRLSVDSTTLRRSLKNSISSNGSDEFFATSGRKDRSLSVPNAKEGCYNRSSMTEKTPLCKSRSLVDTSLIETSV